MPKNKNDPQAIAERLAEQVRAKASAKIIQLPVWQEEHRGSPNEIVRSALFNVRNRRQRRQFIDDQPIVVCGDGEITYYGMELRQDDEDVWLQLLHLARSQPLGEEVAFTPYALLKALSWGTSKRDYDRLKKCLTRMAGTNLKITSKRLGKTVGVSLIRKFEWQNETGCDSSCWRVWIEREMHALFAEPFYTLLGWEQRLQLGPLAKWLHGFYASHAEPYPIKVETLKEASGADVQSPRKFKQTLKAALDELVTVGFLRHWWIEKGLVYVERA